MSKEPRKRIAVRSKYWSVYQAFVNEAKKLGWIWNANFNPYEEYQMKRSNCIFLSDGFTTTEGKDAMSFSNWNKGSSNDVPVFNLDRQFQDAIDAITTVEVSIDDIASWKNVKPNQIRIVE